MRRWSVIAVVALMVATVGCGGGDTNEPADGPAGGGADASSTTSGPGSGDNGTTAAPEQPTSGSGDAGTAVVTIGDMTWQFGLGDQAFTLCDYNQFGTGNLFSAMVQVDDSGAAVMTDGGAAANVVFELYADNYEELGLDPPSIELDDEANEQRWIANIMDEVDFDIQPGISQVTGLTIDGPTASGTATFYDRNVYFAWVGGTGDEPMGVDGTFEVTCAE